MTIPVAVYTEELRRVGYWKCNVPEHRHQSEAAATACMLRRKGVRLEIHRLTRNLIIIRSFKAQLSCNDIALKANCSSSNLLKAANSSLLKAYQYAEANGGCPFKRSSWITSDFCLETKANELNFLVGVLEQYRITIDPPQLI